MVFIAENPPGLLTLKQKRMPVLNLSDQFV